MILLLNGRYHTESGDTCRFFMPDCLDGYLSNYASVLLGMYQSYDLVFPERIPPFII